MKKWNVDKKKARAAVVIFLLAFAIEGLFFNFNSFRLLAGGFSHHNVPLNQLDAQGYEYNPETGFLEYIPGVGDYYIEIKNFNQKAGTVYVDFVVQEGRACNASIWYTDAANRDYVMTDQRTISDSVEESKYFTCWLYGEAGNLRVYFDDTPVVVTGFEINKAIPWKFEPIRFFTVLIIMALFYGIVHSQWLLCPVGEQRLSHRLVSVAVILGFTALAVFSLYTSLESKEFGLDSGDLYSEDLTDAFLAGQTALLEEPDPLLKTMENPYDYEARNAAGVYAGLQYRIDVSYYNDTYYCYFGPVPSLLLFIPFTLLTGEYLQTGWACLFFAVVAAIAIFGALQAFMRRFAPKLPYGYLLLGAGILWFSNSILWNLRRPMVYELAILSSAAFVALGFWMVILAVGRERLYMAPLSLGCISMALAVGCRPLSLLYTLAIIPVLVHQYLKYRQDRKTVFRAALAIGLPYLLIGGALAWYNLERFGSVTEFGVTYQLSTLDMRGENFKPQILPICIWLMMFIPPMISSEFPFVFGSGAEGRLYFIGEFAHQKREVGLFFMNPVLWILFSPRALCHMQKAYGKGAAWAAYVSLACSLLIFVLNSLVGGTAVRYAADYGIVMSAVALLAYFGLYGAAKEKNLDGALSKLLVAAAVIAVFLGFFRSMYGENKWFQEYHTVLYLRLQYLFAFWM